MKCLGREYENGDAVNDYRTDISVTFEVTVLKFPVFASISFGCTR